MNVLLEKRRDTPVVLFGMSAFFAHSCPLDLITPFMLMLQKVAVYTYTIKISLRDKLNALK